MTDLILKYNDKILICENIKAHKIKIFVLKFFIIHIDFKATYNLIQCILEIRILPLKKFDIPTELYFYFMDCLFATIEILQEADKFGQLEACSDK